MKKKKKKKKKKKEKREERKREEVERRHDHLDFIEFRTAMLRRRPSQVPLGAAGEAQRALLAAEAAAASHSSSSGGRCSGSRRRRLAVGVAAALAAAALFSVGVVLGVSSSVAASSGCGSPRPPLASLRDGDRRAGAKNVLTHPRKLT